MGLKVIEFPEPDPDGGRSVQESLWLRKTDRNIGGKKISDQMMSNILWAACGVNRKKGPFGVVGITAASASNSQEIAVYAVLKEGIYRYEPESHCLFPVVRGDLRALAISKKQRPMGSKAPLRLLYVADIDKFSQAGFQEPGLWDVETQKAYYFVDTGLIAGNVYLFAASRGLGAWFHNCDKVGLAAKLKLRPTQRVLFAQTLGYLSP